MLARAIAGFVAGLILATGAMLKGSASAQSNAAQPAAAGRGEQGRDPAAHQTRSYGDQFRVHRAISWKWSTAGSLRPDSYACTRAM